MKKARSFCPSTKYRMKTLYIILAGLLCLLAMSCHVKTQDRASDAAFRLPEIPSTLVNPEERAAYLSVHYWDHYDFSDTTLIDREDITEQAFVNFLSILPYAANAEAAVDTLYRRASVSSAMLYHFIELGDKYLYEPNSPMYNEELHILVLRALLANPSLSEGEKERPRYLLEMALKNRPGDKAADFAYVERSGRKGCLSGITSDYLLLYFNDPECEDCREVKQQLTESQPLYGLLSDGRLAVLSVCVEGKTAAWESAVYPEGWIDAYDEGKQLTRDRVYDLKAMPTLYLLDKEHRVLLKDTSVGQIEAWLSERL